MSFTAGFGCIVAVKATDVAYAPGDVIVGAENLNMPDGVEVLDTSHFNSGGDPSTLPGMFSRGPYSFNVNYDQSDAPQALLFTKKAARAVVYLTMLPDGLNGFRVGVYVNKLDRTTDAKGKTMLAVECSFAGTTPTAIP